MNSTLFPTTITRRHRAGLPARLGSLILLIQRSPLLKLLPEARVLSTSGFSDAIKWTVLTVTGLGAFDSVSGATTVTQVLPTAGSSTVAGTGGTGLNFVFQITGAGGHIPNAFQISGTLPLGLVQTGLRKSKTDSISGTPLQTGSFPVTIIAWENSGFTGRSTRANFTINVAVPPAPVITAQPAGGNFTPGSFVSLTAGHANGFTFMWKKDGVSLQAGTTILSSLNAPRKFLAPTTDPGAGWRSGDTFIDSTWTSVSGGIGYDTSATPVNYLTEIAAGGNVQPLMSGSGKPASALIRIPFTMSGSSPVSTLKLRVQSDDGFVAWLNGTEIASRNKPAALAFNSRANTSTADATAIAFTTYNLNQHITLLHAGQNLLAVQAMNEANTSGDLLFNCELSGGIDGTNTRRLIIPAVDAAGAGAYTVTVTNTAGTVTSDPAAVVLPPSIETQPASVPVSGGQTAPLTVSAVTSPPFTYQWYRGESGDTSDPVAGATGASFTTPVLTTSEKYWVRVANAAGSADSITATISIQDPYTIWKANQFTPAEAADPAISGPTADPDGDGVTDEREYVFGTFPKNPGPPPALAIGFNGQVITLGFKANKATGAGYDGRVRHYAIETTSDISSGPWAPLPSFEDIVANDQSVSTAVHASGNHLYCRLRVWLTP